MAQARPVEQLPVFTDVARRRRRQEKIVRAAAGLRIGVLMGGESGEREVSLRSGRGVAQALRQAGLCVVEIDVDFSSMSPVAEAQIDLAYNALHGGKGEDGTIQGYLESTGIPYTGPGVHSSALCMNKVWCKMVLQQLGLPTPPFVVFGREEKLEDVAQRIEREIGIPTITKPKAEGSSLGVRVAHSGAELREHIARLAEEFGGGLAEPFIPEPELTVGVLHGHPLPVLQLVPKKEFYDYEAKYTKGLTEFIIPADVPENVYRGAQRIAAEACRALECFGVARVDMRAGGLEVPAITDINTSPGMTETSDLPAEAEALGMSYQELVIEVLGSALVRAGLIEPCEWA